ncbi:hypothetical protein BPAE_0335g00010 [Botrytis paeoniae]|uniref:Uncharacterized protein n=1 Tax=Botrytis paeoniae TaxID=278948 RepID=A0A4Z1F7R5_9HELO|nr:hypothetical protein BPAE_0335g00010 [Botrytis paeoniae]
MTSHGNVTNGGLDSATRSTTHLASDNLTNGASTENVIKPIAVVGLSMRFPEDATSSEGFWKMLLERRCVSKDFPPDRINSNAFEHPDSNRSGAWQHSGGFFMQDDLGAFDAPFFSITSKEAAAMDPQQRGILETAYRALENAGIPMEIISGSKTSVHTASFCDDYKTLLTKDPENMPKHSALGVAFSILANRLSWFFNLKGPSVHMDSACSSSLMALDSAFQALQNGDSKMAIVAAANILLSPDTFFMLSNMNFLSPDSRCYSFEDCANGYARGEGYGVVVLKPLDEAIRDNDTIRAVIRSTGSNQDGRTPSMTQPSKDSQERLIRDTYEKAGLDTCLTRFVEAHGTGTVVGDPIEASAIGAAFQEHRSSESPLFIGAVKSNIGHLEGAAGMAGLIKTILVLERGIIPPNVFERLNPRIDAELLKLKFPAEPTPWPSSGLRRASVNSFGFGGSNSHVIIDDAHHFLASRGLIGNHNTVENPPSFESALSNGNGINVPKNGTLSQTPRLLVWSAADENVLMHLSQLYGEHFTSVLDSIDNKTSFMDNLSYTLGVRRSQLPWKSFAVIESLEDLENIAHKASKPLRASGKNKLGYIFTGQGAQYARMGIELLSFPIFEASILKSDAYLRQFGCEWSVLDELQAGKAVSKLDGPAYSQPLCTVLQIALVDLLKSFGLAPSAVIGHSSGEIAAAYSIGGLSQEAACRVAYFRGKFSAEIASISTIKGAMMSIGLSEDRALSYIKQVATDNGKGSISIACVNSPKNVTISGDADQIDALKNTLEKNTIFARKLKVDVAYHSKHMGIIADKYANSLQNLSPGDFPGSATMVSSVSGKVVSVEDLCKSNYWVQNMVFPVRFSEALTQIVQNSGLVSDLLEIGPHSTLQGPIKDTLNSIVDGDKIAYTSILVRFASALRSTLQALGRLHCLGYGVRIANINDHERKLCKSLPNLPEYPFDHSQIYWHESRLSSIGYRLRPYKKLDLLGTPTPDWNPLEARWHNSLSLAQCPWIKDHKVNDMILYPAVGMLIMAIEGMRQLVPEGRLVNGYRIKDATFIRPISISANSEHSTETQLSIQSVRDTGDKGDSWSIFRLYVLENDQWAETCHGSIQIEYDEAKNEVKNQEDPLCTRRLTWEMQTLKETSATFTEKIGAQRVYEHFEACGLQYGPAFRRLQELRFNDKQEATAKVDLFQWIATENANHFQPHVVHPTSLDSMAQLLYFVVSNGTRDMTPTAVPTRVDKIWVSNSGLSCLDSRSVDATGSAAYKGFRQIAGSMFASDPVTGKILVSIENMEFTTLVAQNDISNLNKDEKNLYFNFKWLPSLHQPDDAKLWDYCKQAQSTKENRLSLYQDIHFVLYKFLREAVKIVDDSQPEAKPHIQKYFTWMKRQVEEATSRKLPHSLPAWDSWITDPEYFETACERIQGTGEGKFYLRVGRALPRIVRGDVDPLEVLFKDNLVRDYYEHINNSLISFSPVARYLEVLSHGNPKLNILEIGAGTGSTSTQVLASLFKEDSHFGYAQYDFTDISSAFFETASEKFQNHSSRMKFKTLNVEFDPVQQGFEARSYDVVVAGLVLHATKDLSKTLRNVRTLLKPGGILLLLEMVEEDLRTSFAFGLLSGWWLSTEDYRKWSPHCSTQQWDTLLEQNGFSRSKMEMLDCEGRGCHVFSWLVSTAVEATPLPSSIDLPQASSNLEIIILVLDNHAVQLTAASLLDRELALLDYINCRIVKLHDWTPARDGNIGFTISLLELGKPLLPNFNIHLFGLLQQVLTHVDNIFWVKGGGSLIPADSPEYGSSDGFMRTLQSELNKFSMVTLWLQDLQTSIKSQVSTIIYLFKSRLLNNSIGNDSEYSEKDSLIHVGRLIGSPASNQDLVERTKPQQLKIKAFESGSPLTLRMTSPGFLDSFYFAKDESTTRLLGPTEIEIKVKAVGVNFLDLLTALGRVDTHKTMGCECAGVVTRVGSESSFQPGDRVAANKLDSFQTCCRSNDFCAVKIPDDMSFTTGASLPIIFTTAYHSLVEIARIQPGDKVLIHAGAGGTGGAAIQIAKHFGAEIFTTVGSRAKKELLINFYGIPQSHIFYSRNISFAEDIMRMTNGKGVDIVLNSLSGKGLISSWECMAPFGHFVEIGKRDIHARKDLPMFKFAQNVTFSTVDIAAMISQRPQLIQKSFKPVMDLIRAGVLKPVTPLHIYKMSQLEDAFRYMQSGNNTGKIVIEVQADDNVLTLLDTVPTWNFNSNYTYLIAGGLGGLGRVTARWFARRGARNLILLSRSGAKSQEAIELVQELASQGVRVETPRCDVADTDSLAAIISHYTETMPPIRGCIQGSMLLKDAIYENMTFEDWETATKPRINGSWNLHSVLPKDMDFFLLLSSVCGLIGYASQANYAAGSTYMDALARYRTKHGQKAVSLDLGWMESAGAVAESEFLQRTVQAAGHAIPIPVEYFYAILDKYCDPDLDVGDNVQVAFGLQTPAGLRAKNAEIIPWMMRETFIHLDQLTIADGGPLESGPSINFASLFQTLKSPSEAIQIVMKSLVKKISKALLMPTENIDTSKPLYEYGVDSLLAVELRNWFSRELRADVAVFDIMGSATFEALCTLVVQRSSLERNASANGTD